MVHIVLGLGSNVEREYHLRAGVEALKALDATLLISPVYQSAAIGFEGSDFFNAVVCLNADIELNDLVAVLAGIERQYGRTEGELRFSEKTLDIDILIFGNHVGVFDGVTLPREEITKNAFVLKPLADVCPQKKHPVLLKAYAELWVELQATMQTVQHCTIKL